MTEMSLVTQQGWILTFNDYAEYAILGVTVSMVAADPTIARLKDVAKEHRHPRGGKNRLEWVSSQDGWKADGSYGGSFYLIEPYTVEVLS